LPPGRAKDLTTPDPTGLPTAANTIGITDVACFAATVGGVADVTMTSTLRRTKSAAISARCSLRPSAHRYSIVMVLRWQPGASRRIQGRRDELLGPRSGTDPVAEPASRWPLRVRRPAAPAPAERAVARVGDTDLVARLMGQWLSERLGQPFRRCRAAGCVAHRIGAKPIRRVLFG